MSTAKVCRREFLELCSAVGAGLVLGFYLPAKGEAAPSSKRAGTSFQPNAWIQIDPHGRITLIASKSEMGQGVQTSLPMLIAEELEADWSKIEIRPAEQLNPAFGEQITGGSSSITGSWQPLRKAGATAREMLIAAAAQKWGVRPDACRAREAVVTHVPSGRKLSYGELAEQASRLPVPKEVSLKDPKDYRILGKRIPRFDTPLKVDGSAIFGIDVKVPGMLYATVLRCPVFGGRLSCFDATKAKAVPGVREVFPVGTAESVGVAVVADTTWAALQGRRALQATWDEGRHASLSSSSIRQRFVELSSKPGAVARKEGDAAAALSRAAKKLEAVYEVPYLAHATMEPMNCTANVQSDRCEIWAPTQDPAMNRLIAARVTGLPLEAIKVHITYLGGGFGRRADSDWPREAIQISHRVGAPVKLMWTREDDIQFGYYRPASYSRLTAGLDHQGRLVAWSHQIIGPSHPGHWNPAGVINGLSDSAVMGAFDIPYDIGNIEVRYVMANTPVPPDAMRSVAHSQHAFSKECFLDEVAAASSTDPLELRLGLLSRGGVLQFKEGNSPFVINTRRLRGTLELAANKAGWGSAPPRGRFRGIACHVSFGTYVSQVAEVSLGDDRTPRVHRVVCAVDCGQVVNPDTVEAQMQGAIIFGLSGALYGQITIDAGRVQQSNFHDYRMVRINEAPQIEVHIVPSTEAPGGVGEPGVPPIIPAVANAISAATGQRVRRLPIETS
jgi:isoquinoline 1-oxidoreductase subunit beta